MALNDRREPKLTGEEPLVITTGEIEKIGNALPLTVTDNRFLRATDRNKIIGRNTSTTTERESRTTPQKIKSDKKICGPKKNREKCDT